MGFRLSVGAENGCNRRAAERSRWLEGGRPLHPERGQVYCGGTHGADLGYHGYVCVLCSKEISSRQRLRAEGSRRGGANLRDPPVSVHSQPIDDGRRVPSPPYINRLSTHAHHTSIKYTGRVKSGTHARDHGGGSTGTNAKNGIQSSTIFGPTLSRPPFELMSW
jgi:hypothetical protein